MKKILAAFLAIALAFGLTACGSTEYDEYDQQRIQNCETIANYMLSFMDGIQPESVSEIMSFYNKEEMKYVFESSIQNAFSIAIEAELGAFDGLLTSYSQMAEDMGGKVTIGPCKSKIAGKEIVVTYVMYGDKCDGEVVFEFSNDIFTRFKSGAASAHTSFAQKMNAAGRQMGNAGMNTLLGMGSVFIVLILISLIISSFSLFNRKAPEKTAKPAAAVAEPAPATAESEELVDDSELVAVITAAIAAFEGSAVSAGPDGFVVRSIRKANRRR